MNLSIIADDRAHFILGILLFFWGLRLVVNLMSHIQRWYIKEYRFDRMLIYLKENFLLNVFFPPLRRMRLSPKTTLLCIISGILLGALFTILQFPILVKFLILDVLEFAAALIAVLILKIPTIMFHRLVVWRAKRKLHKYPKLKIIGITGSFGKTSTKEFLKTILSAKYRVLATEKSKNSTIGIAEVILKELDAQHEIFIVEMGAYKIGEIKEICSIVKPNIGIITGINEQHIELFGSLSQTRKAKYELVEALPQNGLAVFNADNQYTRLMAKQTRNKTVLLYGNTKDAQVRISHLSQQPTQLSFTLELNKIEFAVKTPLLGKHFALNIAAAAAVAYYLKLSQSTIKQQITHLTSAQSGMKVAKYLNGAAMIDNTFNANPDSVKAAVDYLTVYSGKKYLILTPLIELGKQGPSIHEDLGKYIGKKCDGLIVTNKRYFKQLKLGLDKFAPKCSLTIASGKKAAQLVRKTVALQDGVVFAGKETTAILAHL